jgi:hypothetical protein
MICHKSFLILFFTISLVWGFAANSYDEKDDQGLSIPDEIQRIMNNPFYDGAMWGLRVVDLDTGTLVYDLNPDTLS